jgi:hypothetical protein
MPSDAEGLQGWQEYRRLVVDGLEKLERNQNELRARIEAVLEKHAQESKREADVNDQKIGTLRDRITRLEVTMKFQAGLWGGIASVVISVVAGVLVSLLIHH